MGGLLSPDTDLWALFLIKARAELKMGISTMLSGVAKRGQERTKDRNRFIIYSRVEKFASGYFEMTKAGYFNASFNLIGQKVF